MPKFAKIHISPVFCVVFEKTITFIQSPLIKMEAWKIKLKGYDTLTWQHYL